MDTDRGNRNPELIWKLTSLVSLNDSPCWHNKQTKKQSAAEEGEKRKWNIYIPPVGFTTDNAAMIGIAGYYKYLRGEFSDQGVTPLARY